MNVLKIMLEEKLQAEQTWILYRKVVAEFTSAVKNRTPKEGVVAVQGAGPSKVQPLSLSSPSPRPTPPAPCGAGAGRHVPLQHTSTEPHRQGTDGGVRHGRQAKVAEERMSSAGLSMPSGQTSRAASAGSGGMPVARRVGVSPVAI